MKILHTSDWHIGQTLYGHDRTEDHIHFFKQLKEIIAAEHPDALLVSGDIFDVSNPSSASVRLFNDTLLEINDSNHGMTTVVTAGNHDSASRIDVNRNLWKKAGIHVVGGVARIGGKYEFGSHVIPVADKGFVAAIPHVNRAFMNTGSGDESPEMGFFHAVAEEMKRQNGTGLPAVLMAHLTVDGCDRLGHTQQTIGNIESVRSDIFDACFDYVALGHIHRPQTLGDKERIRYSGTPVAISFDEDYPHTVSIVDVEPGQSPKIREIEIEQLTPLLTVPKTPASYKEVLQTLERLPRNKAAFIRLNFAEGENVPSDFEEQAVAMTRDSSLRYCTSRFEKKQTVDRTNAMKGLTLAEFHDLTPREVARRLFLSRDVDEVESDRMCNLINEIEKEIENAQNA